MNEKRYIVGLKLAGDFIDLGAFLGRASDFEAVTLGPARLASLRVTNITGWLAKNPQLAALMLSDVLRAEAISRQWSLRVASLDAPHRIAHLLAEVRSRLTKGNSAPRVLRTPFKQTDIADICGISAIHTNRALATIRNVGLGEMRRGDFHATDWSKLEAYAQFDASYLEGLTIPAPLKDSRTEQHPPFMMTHSA